MSVLKSYFNKEVNQNTERYDDYVMVTKTGKDGVTVTVPQKVDYKSIQRQNGPVENWSLHSLMSSGIDVKSLTPKTGKSLGSGLEGYDNIEDLLNDLKSVDVTTNTIQNKE